jgi:hypothetical protein
MNQRLQAGALPRRAVLGWRDDSGKSSIRGLIALLLIAGMVYVCMKFIPVRAAAYQFNDAIRDEVVYVSNRRTTDDQIMLNLLERAVMLGLPVTREKIRIQRTGRNKYIVIEANYTVTVELLGGYEYTWEFSQAHEGPIF